jgi:hypothetical protein
MQKKHPYNMSVGFGDRNDDGGNGGDFKDIDDDDDNDDVAKAEEKQEEEGDNCHDDDKLKFERRNCNILRD